jgi:hypothetical protein
VIAGDPPSLAAGFPLDATVSKCEATPDIPRELVRPRYPGAAAKSAFKLRAFGYDLGNFQLFIAWEEMTTASNAGKIRL